MLRLIRAYLTAVVIAYVAAVTAGTLGVMNTIAEMGLTVTAGDRLGAVLHDLIGMAGSYLPLIAIALLIALPVAGQLSRWIGGSRSGMYALGGFVAITALHLIMEMVLGLVGIAAARTAMGLTGQALAGAFAALIFAQLTVPKSA